MYEYLEIFEGEMKLDYLGNIDSIEVLIIDSRLENH